MANQIGARAGWWAVFGALSLLGAQACGGDDGGGDGDGDGDGTGGDTAETGGSANTGDGDGTGGSEPTANCGDELICESGEVCILAEGLFTDVESDECAPTPDGCSSSAICDCPLADWEGMPISGCVAFGFPGSLYVYDLDCGDAPCEEGNVCLFDETGANPPTCVAAPDGCTVDDTFCEADCEQQVAEAAGMDIVSCRASSVGAGVTVTPPE